MVYLSRITTQTLQITTWVFYFPSVLLCNNAQSAFQMCNTVKFHPKLRFPCFSDHLFLYQTTFFNVRGLFDKFGD